MTILPLDEPAAIIAGNIRATLRRLGAPLGLADVLIGATALASNCTLVTGNVAHFARIPHLPVENWLERTACE